MQDNKKYLLPIGFYDLLDEEALINQKITDIVLKKFSYFSYNLIKTPLVEFSEIIPNNQKIARNSFKIFDNLSVKDLIIRSDITIQIARLMATRLRNRPLPIKLCYVGDVLNLKSDDLYSNRQLTQAGIEFIGSKSLESNLEVIEVIASSLKEIGLSNLIFDFCIPQFLEMIMLEIAHPDSNSLKIAIRQKNLSAIKSLAGKFAEPLITLAMEISDLSIIKKQLTRLTNSNYIIDQFRKMEEIISVFSKKYQDLSFNINIFGDNEFSYHQEIAFTIFETSFCYPIARGGRYLINNKIPAVGSTIYVNNLRKILVKNS